MNKAYTCKSELAVWTRIDTPGCGLTLPFYCSYESDKLRYMLGLVIQTAQLKEHSEHFIVHLDGDGDEMSHVSWWTLNVFQVSNSFLVARLVHGGTNGVAWWHKWTGTQDRSKQYVKQKDKTCFFNKNNIERKMGVRRLFLTGRNSPLLVFQDIGHQHT